jgi:hypothetical protein
MDRRTFLALGIALPLAVTANHLDRLGDVVTTRRVDARWDRGRTSGGSGRSTARTCASIETTRPSAPSATGSRSCDACPWDCMALARRTPYVREVTVMADNDKVDREKKDEPAKEKRDKNGSLPGVDKKRWDDFKQKG